MKVKLLAVVAPIIDNLNKTEFDKALKSDNIVKGNFHNYRRHLLAVLK